MKIIKQKASTAEKHTAQASGEPKFQNGLSKIEGILTSAINFKLKGLGSQKPYFYGFFQLEGISQDIPIIFKIKNQNPEIHDKPKITPQSKVLLTGTWSESPNNTRPSFTCTEYQILANPAPPTIKSLREQISQLLTTSLEKKKEWQE